MEWNKMPWFVIVDIVYIFAVSVSISKFCYDCILRPDDLEGIDGGYG